MFRKGNIQIAIRKTDYAPGDTISGNLILTLDKAIEARNLSISLIGERTRRQKAQRGGTTVTDTGRRHTLRIYDFRHELDGEKQYNVTNEYQFELKVPDDIPGVASFKSATGGMLGRVLTVVKTLAYMLGFMPYERTKWYLLAKLDIPKGLNVNKKANVMVV